ncbi:MAG: LD-carboxypeptidase [Lachnospiraceae bacterium]|nr:LD-carboxypeptidase [Lachnospiraceae bacterium]
MIKKGDHIGIVCCSNGQTIEQKADIEQLITKLQEMGLCVTLSPCLYAEISVFSGTAKQRARALMDFYQNPQITAIFDISGGDIANTVLPYLDYGIIANNPKPIWGYSDLTTVLNAVYAKTGNTNVLYQIKNIIWDINGLQEIRLQNQIQHTTAKDSLSSLYGIHYQFLQGASMEGILIGGNIRCLLKLAGTEYMPDMEDKLLLLEGCSGGAAQYATYLAQLKQLHVFEQVAGILLGTFTQMEQEKQEPTVEAMLLHILSESVSTRVQQLPVAKTYEIGHGTNSKAIEIGVKHRFTTQGDHNGLSEPSIPAFNS